MTDGTVITAAEIGDHVTRVGPGGGIGYPAGGAAHRLVNCGSGGLRVLLMGQRLDHGVCDYPDQGKQLYRNAGQPWDLVDRDAIAHSNAGAKK